MALDFSTVEDFVSHHQSEMRDKVLNRHDRYRILAELREALDRTLLRHESLEDNLSATIRAASEAESYNGLKELHRRTVSEIKNYFLEERTVLDVHDMLSPFRDAVTFRILTLVENEMEDEGYGAVPVEYCWAGVGSEGRVEHTFVTEQSNLIVYSDTDKDFATDRLKTACLVYLKKAEARTKNNIGPREWLDYYFALFSEKAVKRLDFMGFSRCAGGIIAADEKWRGSLSHWMTRIEEALDAAGEERDLVDLFALVDARPIRGSVDLLDGISGKFKTFLHNNDMVMKKFTQRSVLMPTALGLLGRFRLETGGENKGRFDMRLLGWHPLVFTVRILALKQGVDETNTLKRIRTLGEANGITKEIEEELIEAYLVFMESRLLGQIQFEGDVHMTYINPERLAPEDSWRLRKAMGSVENFQKYINESLLLGQAPMEEAS
jgi:CBS domain-containing protein